jgi:hypothetical protein
MVNIVLLKKEHDEIMDKRRTLLDIFHNQQADLYFAKLEKTITYDPDIFRKSIAPNVSPVILKIYYHNLNDDYFKFKFTVTGKSKKINIWGPIFYEPLVTKTTHKKIKPGLGSLESVKYNKYTIFKEINTRFRQKYGTEVCLTDSSNHELCREFRISFD